MTSGELKNLSRGELLEMLIAQVEENEKLRAKLQEAERELNSRYIKVNEAGSIAEAALQLNGVFQAAEAAAQQYLDNIRTRNELHEKVCKKEAEEARVKADAIIAEAEAYSEALRSKTQRFCKKKVDEAQAMYDEQLQWYNRHHAEDGVEFL